LLKNQQLIRSLRALAAAAKSLILQWAANREPAEALISGFENQGFLGF
jgi:hypothetical protein